MDRPQPTQTDAPKLATVMDIRAICRGFPALPPHLVERENVLDTLDSCFVAGAQLVAIEGEDGLGKTSLAAQFALRHASRAIAVFAKPTSRYAYDAWNLQVDLCGQLQWRLTGVAGAHIEPEQVTDQLRLALLVKLGGKSIRDRDPYYFVIDGLDEIPEEDAGERQQILDFLPFGHDQFRFLYVGELLRLPEIIRRTMSCKTFPLSRFSLDEARIYCRDLGLDEEVIRRLYSAYRGLPGYFAAVRATLDAGVPIERILNDAPPQFDQLYAYQWKPVDEITDPERDVLRRSLAILALDRGQYRVGDLHRLSQMRPSNANSVGSPDRAEAAGVSIRQLDLLFRRLPFLDIGLEPQPSDLEDRVTRERNEGFLRLAEPGGSSVIEGEISVSSDRDTNDTSGEHGSRLDALRDRDERWRAEATITFASDGFRAYAAHMLGDLQGWVQVSIEADLARRPDSMAALERLPLQYADSRRYEDLFHYLTPAHFLGMIEQGHSLAPALRNARLGARAAHRAGRDIDLLQIGLEHSLLLELDGGIESAEVEARMALGDVDVAIALAQSAVLLEERLHLLAIVARELRMRGTLVAPELLQELQQLAQQADWSGLGERTRAIALDLLFSVPEVALEVLRMAPHRSEEPHSSNDLLHDRMWLDRVGRVAPDDLAGFELLLPTDGLSSAHASHQAVIEELAQWISDPATKQLTTATILLLGDHDADQALQAVDGIQRIEDRIFLLRNWVARHTRRADTGTVIHVVLDLILSPEVGEYAPSAAVFRDLAAPLPHLPDVQETRRLIDRFDSLQDIIAHRGPTQDYLRLQMLLARAEAGYAVEKAHSRLVEVWIVLDQFEDVVARAEGQARLLLAFDAISVYAHKTGLVDPITLADRQVVEKELAVSIEELRCSTADHLQAFSGVIRLLARRDPQQALALARSLNSTVRRQIATFLVITEVITHAHDGSVCVFLQTALNHLRGTALFDGAVARIAEDLATKVKEGPFNLAPFISLLTIGQEATGAVERCRALTYAASAALATTAQSTAFALSAMNEGQAQAGARALPVGAPTSPTAQEQPDPAGDVKTPFPPGLANHLLAQAQGAWDALDEGWRKISTGFKMARTLASTDPSRARGYLDQTEQLRTRLLLGRISAGSSYAESLSLTIRAYGGLLAQRTGSATDLARLKHLIDALPSRGDRAVRWAEVAAQCYLYDRQNECMQLVEREVLPLYQNLSAQDGAFRWRILHGICCALYCAHPDIIDRWVGEAPPLDRSFMYRRIGRFLLYRRWPSEPIASRPKQLVDVTYATLLKVCTLLERIEEDSLLVGLMSDIADCIVQGRAQNRHLREYQAEVAKRLREIGQARLPQATNITHEGYKIMAQAQAVRCDPFQHGQASAWLPLAEAARAIPNTADRAFVLGYLASMTPVVAQRNAWFAEAEVAAQGIAGRIDRADHFEGLANLALDHIGGESGQSLARSYVEKATVTLLGAREDPSSHAMLQRLVDMAYQIDQDWAATLATQADDDPARLAQRAKGAALRNQMLGRDAVSSESGQQARRATGPVAVGTTGAAIMHATPRGGDEPREAQEDQEVGEYVEVALALLSSLNAGRVPTKHFEETRRFLWVASQSPLSDAYPIYAWILENAAVRFRFQRPNAAVDSSLRVLFEATVNATELAGKLIAYTSQRALESARYSAYYTTDQAPSSETGIRLIRTGEHEAAVEYIRAWLMAHAVDYLLLIDPYFSRQDLEWLNLMAEACPGLPVNILTGARAQHQEQLEGTLDELYQAHWRQAVSDQAPPPTQVTVVGIGKGGPAPFHDRWLLTHGAGLEVGGSFNGLGAKDLIQLTPVSAEDAARVEQMYQQYLLGRAWLSDGQRLYYMMFHL